MNRLLPFHLALAGLSAVLASAAWSQAPESVPAPAPLAITPETTITARQRPTSGIITTTTLMNQNVGRRMELYRRAGFSAEKLTALEPLHQELFAARLDNQTTRSAEIRRRINDMITNEEQISFDRTQRQALMELREELARQRAANQPLPPPSQ